MDRIPHWLRPAVWALFTIPLLWSAASTCAPYPVGVFEGIPREIGVEDGKLKGRFASLYQCVFDRVDGDFRFFEMPLARILFELEKGDLAVGLPLVQTSGRDQYADFGGRLFQTEYVYLFLENYPLLRQVPGLRFAFVRRFIGDHFLQGEGARVVTVSEWKQAVEMVKLGRADVVVLPGVLVDQLMAGYLEPYYVRTAAWVDLSLYVSHRYGSGQLTADLRRAIAHCSGLSDVE
ncbi:transporter substrate-binding domain-containing protein [Marinobacter daepoensis]|uniref:transporter substrate-binding domain-containing protein n=1 Tax=Marinobacter daepoensis TaxID=262077 RepID=UPI001C95167B|nr:transporter substrate-binding domain-containing protein [Marinobacter daepoensis]MBY6034212.1 transporter substrate-binding domain-containing protein [Marinobacter daepoensis]